MTRSDIAVFLDRDGTVNVEENYISSPDQLQLIPRAGTAIRELNKLGTRVFIITNQSGVARGYFSEAAVHDIHEALRALLKKENAFVDDFFYCPHLPGAEVERYNIVCDCRKPKPGMLLQAQQQYAVDLRRSFVVGDRCIDIAAGKAVGAGTVMVSTGYGTQEILNCRNQPDFFAHDLLDGVQYIKQTIESQEHSFSQSRTA
jgi:D-glycero-D-manno-heptose 1,7-bisphosphate phosphatase